MNKDFDRKRTRALSLLSATGIMKRNYLPPTFSVLWQMGVAVPPPHFLSFPAVVMVMGLPFGICWIGLFMTTIENGDLSLATGLWVLLLAVFIPGLTFGSYYYAGRKRFRLPLWADL
jgi:hypothetical protein